jgi:hypothetical protein
MAVKSRFCRVCGEPFQAVRFFDRPKSAPIVHRKHAGTVPLPHRCRAASTAVPINKLDHGSIEGIAQGPQVARTQ